MDLVFLLYSVFLLGATAAVVRPAFAAGAGTAALSLDGIAVLAAFGGVVLLATGLGPLFAFALVLALMLNEIGQVLAYRLAGHEDARVRLVTSGSGWRISGRAPVSDGTAAFIALMGPGISLAPMVAALSLAGALQPALPALSDFLRLFALATGAVNFVALMPLWPFSGGQIVRAVIQAWLPARGPLSAAFMCAALMGASLTLGSVFLFCLSLAGALSLAFERQDAPRPALRPRELWLALAAYVVMLGAFFTTGWWVLRLLAAG